MAILTRVTATNVAYQFTGATAGQDITANGVTPTLVTGDLVPIGSGTGTLVIVTSAGTGGTIVLDSVLTSSYGTDQDLTITFPATGLVVFLIDNDGYNRFDQGGGSAGLAKLVFSAVTNVKLYAVTVP